MTPTFESTITATGLYPPLFDLVPLNHQIPISAIHEKPGEFQPKHLSSSFIVKFHTRETKSHQFHHGAVGALIEDTAGRVPVVNTP
jgi:hypothetical protein